MFPTPIHGNRAHATENTDTMDNGFKEVAEDKKPSRSSLPNAEGPLANLLRREPHLVQEIASHLDPRSVRSFAQVSNLTRPYLQVELGAAAIESRAPHLRAAELGQARTAAQQLPPNCQAGPINAIEHQRRALDIAGSAHLLTNAVEIDQALSETRRLPADFQSVPVNAIMGQLPEVERHDPMVSSRLGAMANIRDAAQGQ